MFQTFFENFLLNLRKALDDLSCQAARFDLFYSIKYTNEISLQLMLVWPHYYCTFSGGICVALSIYDVVLLITVHKTKHGNKDSLQLLTH